MQIAIVGLGRMGRGFVLRLLDDNHTCVVTDIDSNPIDELAAVGAVGAYTYADMAAAIDGRRVVWLMVPPEATDSALRGVAAVLASGDVVIDGGNSNWRDDLSRSVTLDGLGIEYVDVGTSGGVWGRERGYCLMVGGKPDVVASLEPILDSLAPGISAASRTPGRLGPSAPEERGWLHCGPTGTGHFVKMVHNGIEYGMMAAIAEGLALLDRAGIDRQEGNRTEASQSHMMFPSEIDLGAIAELWRRGSVISSWLLDLMATSLLEDPLLERYGDLVGDSGQGRWTAQAALELGVPASAITAAVNFRLGSQGGGELTSRALSAMRHKFGGHS